MEGLLFLLVPLALLIVVGLAVAMLVDVALLGGDRVVEERQRMSRWWRPPYVTGAALLSWAREAGKELVGRALEHDPSGATPVEISAKLHDGAMRAMLPRVSEHNLRREVPCPVGGQGTIGVTALEAIELAEYIRNNLSAREQQSILGRARAYSDVLADDASGGASRTGCALQGGDCLCMTYGARPLRCRPLHAAMILDRFGLGSWHDGADESDAARSRIIAEGVEEGLVGALDIAGLDANLYELNGALAKALETPDAARQWLDGESVFLDCRPAPASTFDA